MKTKTIIIALAVVLVAGGIIAVTASSFLNRYPVADDGTRLPKVTVESEGIYAIEIPDDPKPKSSYVKVLEASESTTRSQKGDLVSIHFQLVDWETGAVKESTRNLTKAPIKVEAGLEMESLFKGTASKSKTLVPKFLSDALVDCAPGDRKLVVFPENTPDLPVHLPRDGAYAIVVDVYEVES